MTTSNRLRAPSRTIQTSAVAGAVTTIIVWALQQVSPGLEIPADVAAAITMVISFLAGWAVPDPAMRRRPPRHRKDD